MIHVFEICDELVTTIQGFQDTVVGRAVTVERAYHFVDKSSIDQDTVSIVLYPLSRRKEVEGSATKLFHYTVYASIRTKALPSDKELLDGLLTYGDQLDEFLEGKPMCGAKYSVPEDDQFYWFPNELHSNNHFSSLLELNYRMRVRIGGNPT